MADTRSSKMSIAVKSASLNMLLQIGFRLTTFLMNAVLLRYISSELLGLVNVRLALLYNTILFISREAFRKACLSRITSDEKYSRIKIKQIINLIWVAVIVGLVTSFILSFLWISYLEQPSENLSRQYKLTCFTFAISAICELFVEPLWIFGQRVGLVTSKVLLEGCLLFIRCTTSTFLVTQFPQLGLYSFAISYLLSSICYTIFYFTYFYTIINSGKNLLELKTFRDVFPDLKVEPNFDVQYTTLVKSFYRQSLLKQFLTEGEKYVMTLFNVLSLSQQGVYDIINNLGSLAARFIFMPIEESYYVHFSQIIKRGEKKNSSATLKQCNDTISFVLKFVSLISAIIVVFGFNYSYLLLDIYGGKILSEGEGPVLLRTYCIYVIFLAVNGITECFMFASMSQKEIDRYNYKMLVFSCIFLLSSLIFTQYFGSIGFVIANCLNMAIRIFQSSRYINVFFEESYYRPLNSIIPSQKVCISLFISFALMAFSESRLCCAFGWLYRIIHVVVGGVCLSGVLTVIYFTEHSLINVLKELREKKE